MNGNPFKAVIARPDKNLLHRRGRVEDARQIRAAVKTEIKPTKLTAASTPQVCCSAGTQIAFAASEQLSADRLFRCNGGSDTSSVYPVILTPNGAFRYDPVEENEFWFKKKPVTPDIRAAR